MNNYKERYELLEKDILEIEKNKKKKEQSLMVKGMKLEEENMKISELELELLGINYDRNEIMNSKEKLINAATDTLRVILLGATLALSIISYNMISPIKAISKILIGLALTYGGVAFLSLGLWGIKNVEKMSKKNNMAKNASKKECLELTEKVDAKTKELEKEKQIQSQIKEEVDRLSKEINTQKELLSSKQYEVAKLFEEIITAAINEVPASEEIVQTQEEIPAQTPEKPKTKVRKPENK